MSNENETDPRREIVARALQAFVYDKWSNEYLLRAVDGWRGKLPLADAILAALDASQPQEIGPPDTWAKALRSYAAFWLNEASRDVLEKHDHHAYPWVLRRIGERLSDLADSVAAAVNGDFPALDAAQPVVPTLDDRLKAAPLGTLAPAYNGGAWCKVENGWKWNGHLKTCSGGTFPRPGGDWTGKLQFPEPPTDEEVAKWSQNVGSVRAAWLPLPSIAPHPREAPGITTGHVLYLLTRATEIIERQQAEIARLTRERDALHRDIDRIKDGETKLVHQLQEMESAYTVAAKSQVAVNAFAQEVAVRATAAEAEAADLRAKLAKAVEALEALVDRNVVYDGGVIRIDCERHGNAIGVMARARTALASIKEDRT